MARIDYQGTAKPLWRKCKNDRCLFENSAAARIAIASRSDRIRAVKTVVFALSDGHLRRYNHGFLRRRLVLTRLLT